MILIGNCGAPQIRGQTVENGACTEQMAPSHRSNIILGIYMHLLHIYSKVRLFSVHDLAQDRLSICCTVPGFSVGRVL